MATRGRAEGWKHAKLSGHTNESIITKKINSNKTFSEALRSRIGGPNHLELASFGGLNEKNVKDVFGGNTKSKTDLALHWKGPSITNISIKKSASGQVYLIGVDRFIAGFEIQFKRKIHKDVKRAIRLFIAGAPDTDQISSSMAISSEEDCKIREYERRKMRLTWRTLEKYNDELSECLLSWVKSHIKELTFFCFQRGLAVNRQDWADFVWYHNEVNEKVVDVLFNINQMSEELSEQGSLSHIAPGTIGGGTTIKLPFGFVQWHQGKIQFHHQQKELLRFCKPILG